ncbi:hypothetical protein MBCUT_19550 [Methanobrevibacter cuticularis]|uniref:Chromosome partition protein Smc n=1 Tax=Methanobrevibacter cuticularis TaxID=47311 RepID=A0A166CQD6_9EURY|nr:hypothetical protein [Methanobrevibacter cuticularis]KZX14761.1 hypothetical protein MBCUT_19550 [Methanobrevibacter cuticularis]
MKNDSSNSERNDTTINFTELKKELKSKKIQLNKANERIATLNKMLDSCHERLDNNINEKSKLYDEVQKFQVMKLNLQLKKLEDIEQKFLKSEHRAEVTKKLLDDSKREIAILKRIINEFENLSFYDFIRNNRSNSYSKYFKK